MSEPVNYTDKDTIFVSIASYRDNRCSRTIESLFENANKPNNIWVGLCEQNKGDEDEPCFSPKWKSRVRQIKIPHWDAKGPTWARYLCASLLDGEKFFLQIDSHSLFAKGWDLYLVKTIRELELSGFKRSILSHYIRSDQYYNESGDSKFNSDTKIPTICTSSFNAAGIIKLNAAHDIQLTDPRPKPNAYIAGGMIFGSSDFIREVPLDPDLPNLFVGEEILYSARLWTHGWNIFTPTKNVIYHYYTRSDEPKYWTDNKEKNENGVVDDSDALQKVKFLLGLEEIDKDSINKHVKKNLDVYGLGKIRSIQDYYNFAGIQLNNNKNKEDKSKDVPSSTDFCKTSNDDLYKLIKRYNIKTYEINNETKEINNNSMKLENKKNDTKSVVECCLQYTILFIVILIVILLYFRIRKFGWKI